MDFFSLSDSLMMMDTTSNTTGIDDFEQENLTISSTLEESSGSNYHTNNNNSTCCNDEDEQVMDSYICESNNRLWIKKNKQPSPPISVLRYGLKDMQWLGEKKCQFKMKKVADRFVIPANMQVVLEEFMTEEEKELVLVNNNSKKMKKNGGGLKVKVVDRFGRKRSIVLKKWESNKRYLLCKGWKEFVRKWVMIAYSKDSSPGTIVQMWCSRLPADQKFKLFFGFDFISAS